MTDEQASALAALEREYGNAKIVDEPGDQIMVVCKVTWPQGPGYMARLIGSDGKVRAQMKGLPK